MQKIQTANFNVAVYAQGDPDASKVTLVIPGRLDSKDYAHMHSHVDFLAKKGFYALSFDPPGVWDSDGEISVYTTSNYLKVIHELIETLGNRPTLLVGHSRGGGVAMLVAAQNKHVCGIVPVLASYGAPSPPKQSTVEAGFELDYRDMPPGDKKTDEQKEFKLPLNYFLDGEKHHPGKALADVQVPKLFVISKHDEFMDVDNVMQTIENSPGVKTVYDIDCEHDYRYHPEKVAEVNEALGQFIKENGI